MELNLAKTVVSYLKAHPDEKFTARQIAECVNQRAKLTRQPGVSALNFDHPG